MKIKEITVKSILTPSKIPSADYVINPYSGCIFGCIYCYAEFMRKFSGHMDDEWGDYVDIKTNAPELLEKELQKLSKKKSKENNFKKSNHTSLFIGSVTDPYQSVEAKYKITRNCLKVLIDSKIVNDIDVSLLTKSSLVTRDIDLFKQIPNLEVGLTITSTDDEICKAFELRAPISNVRIKALEELNKAGIDTYAFVGPLLPHYVKKKENLDELFAAIAKTGTKRVFIEHLNLSWNKWNRLYDHVKNDLSSEDIKLLKESQKDGYKAELNETLYDIIEKYNLELVGGEIIDHQKMK